ncbi:MAG: PP2C family protein-serine/threonine phosphatase, partial [Planctomycetota bacterium]
MEKHASDRCSAGQLDVGWMSDVGTIRRNNEDCCLARPRQGLIAVSDGMGGESAGEIASQCVVDWLPALVEEHVGRLQEPETRQVEAALRDVINVVNHRLRSESSALDGFHKMGATVTMALLRDARAHLAHVGDSSAYHFHDGRLQRLTRDHSVVGRLVEAGAITPEQAVGHPLCGQLSRYVGMGGNSAADVFTVELSPGDLL